MHILGLPQLEFYLYRNTLNEVGSDWLDRVVCVGVFFVVAFIQYLDDGACSIWL